MKKLLSLVLAMALIFSLVPTIFAAAEGEAVAETISYQIRRSSLSKGLYAGEHHIPMENDKLSFTYLNSKKEIVPYTASNTIYNVVINLNGNYTKDTSTTSVANSEISFLTYRNLDYYVYGVPSTDFTTYSPVRSFHNVTNNPILTDNAQGFLSADGTTPRVFTMSPTLNNSVTAPFEPFGRSQNLGHSFLEDSGYRATMIIGAKGATYKKTKDTAAEPSFMVRIKIPEDAVAGKYNIKVGNDWPVDNGAAHYADAHAVLSEVYVTKVGSQGFEGLFDKSGYVINYTDSEGNILPRSAYADPENMLTGLYDTKSQSSKLFPDVFEFAPGEEYMAYFRIAADSIEYNEDGTVKNSYDASSYKPFKLSYIDLVPVVEDEEYKESFDAKEETYTTSGKAIVNTYAYTDKGEKIESIETAVEKALGEVYTYTAPEKEGKNFLYWAKGASEDKIIVSYKKELTYKPSEGQNYLIAVYEDKENAAPKAEFYNANGDRIATADSVVFPARPTLAGYGAAEGWTCYNNGKFYNGTETDIELSGTMIFVAKYKENPDKVQVNGKDYSYGELVSLTAEDVSGKVFKGWKKNGEIVSVSKTYNFYAYKTCTVEAVYADEAPNFSGKFIKILIDTFSAGNDTSVMAEFIGLSDAVEKGIIVNGAYKIPMKSDASQFTVNADVDGTYEGYAIVKDGSSYNQVKDGSIEVKK